MSRFKISLLVAVAVVGLGIVALTMSGDTEKATIEVASLPAAEVLIDGVSHGTTPVTITIEPGRYEVTLREAGFIEVRESIEIGSGHFEARSMVLSPEDPDDPVTLAKLAAPFEVEIEEFEAPARHRGRSKSLPAVLLWPHRDVRLAGLSSFAIEVDETYDSDAYLEFREGRKVLYRERFDPAKLTTVALIPSEVSQTIEVGDRITWGLYFEDNRRPIKSAFKIVRNVKADRKLAKIAADTRLDREPPIVRALLEAKVLENYRLYSEALVEALAIAREHEDSIQPYRTVVGALRRMDGTESRLWAVASQFVTGKGRGRGSPTALAALQAPSPLVPRYNEGAISPSGAVAQLPQAGPGSAAPTSPAQAPGIAAPQESAEARRLAERANQFTNRAEEAARVVSEAQSQLEDLRGIVSDSEAEAQAAQSLASQAREAAEAARLAMDEDPNEMNARALERAEQAQRDADEQAAMASSIARARADEFEAAREEFDQLQEQATGLAQAAADAARAAGLNRHEPVQVQQPSQDEQMAALQTMKTELDDAQDHVDRTKVIWEEAIAAADGSDDPRLLEEVAVAEKAHEEARAAHAQISQEYSVAAEELKAQREQE